jgi:DNA-binding ferritin-like protein
MNEDLQEKFNEAQTYLKQAAEAIQSLLGGESVPPPAAKARYESITKIEEAYMWMANGVQSLLALESKVAEAAQQMANDAANGKKPELKVV